MLKRHLNRCIYPEVFFSHRIRRFQTAPRSPFFSLDPMVIARLVPDDTCRQCPLRAGRIGGSSGFLKGQVTGLDLAQVVLARKSG